MLQDMAVDACLHWCALADDILKERVNAAFLPTAVVAPKGGLREAGLKDGNVASSGKRGMSCGMPGKAVSVHWGRF